MNIHENIKSWIANNQKLIRDFKVSKYKFLTEYHIVPNNIGACEAWLKIHTEKNLCDIDLGVNIQLVDIPFSGSGEIIEILDSVKEGLVEEKIERVFGQLARSAGSLKLKKGNLQDFGYSFPFNILLKFFNSKEEKIKYQPW